MDSLGSPSNTVGTSLRQLLPDPQWNCITKCIVNNNTTLLEELRNLNFVPAADKVGTFYLNFTVSDDGPNTNDGNASTDKNSITESLEILVLNFNDTYSTDYPNYFWI